MTLDLADRMAIHDLFAAYCQSIDRGDAEGWASFFTGDGVFNAGTELTGTEQLEAMARNVATSSGGKWRHLIFNILLAADGADGATFTGNGMLTDWTNGGRLAACVDYQGWLRKIDGNWRIAKLLCTPA